MSRSRARTIDAPPSTPPAAEAPGARAANAGRSAPPISQLADDPRGGGTLVTRADAVRLLGLASPRALDKLIERGAPGPRPGTRGSRRYDVPAIAAWRTAREARQAPGIDLMSARAKLTRVQTQLTALKLREARGHLIRLADAEHVLRGLAAAVRGQLLAVPRRAVLAGLPREHEALVTREIHAALRELSEVRTLKDLEARA